MKPVYILLFIFMHLMFNGYGQWEAKLSEATEVKNTINYPNFSYFPDGHISIVPDGEKYIMFWAEFESHRSVGPSPFVEEQEMLEPSNAVFGKRGNFNSWDNGGSWLMSVFREKDDNFIAFYHAEDHWYPHTSNDIAWKSIAVTYSDDKGKSWSAGSQIITSSTPRPVVPQWGGTGDCCVVWDHINQRWMCYYQEQQISMAVSTDSIGAPGTWKKYYKGDFTEDGLGGEQSPLPGLENYPGGNPSVHWNTYLNKWVMVWHGWAPAKIYVSVSANGINWDTPQAIISSAISGRAWYPTIIGVTDVEAGQTAKIYYADIASDFSYRKFMARTITFIDKNNLEAPIASVDAPIDGSVVSSHEVIIKSSIINISDLIQKVEFYVNDELIGTDYSFPHQYSWQPKNNGSYSIKAVYYILNGEQFESPPNTINVDFGIGIEDRMNEIPDYLIYPSPFFDKITISGMPAGNKEICIYSVNSTLVYRKYHTGQQIEINLSDLNPGIYLLMVKDSHACYQKKIKKK
jgi:hypothetical protein